MAKQRLKARVLLLIAATILVQPSWRWNTSQHLESGSEADSARGEASVPEHMASSLSSQTQQNREAGEVNQEETKPIEESNLSMMSSDATATRDEKTGQVDGKLFIPGSLNVSRLEAFRQCYVDPKRYRPHFRGSATQCKVSLEYNLITHFVLKAGSTTLYEMMKTLRSPGQRPRREGCNLKHYPELTYRSDSASNVQNKTMLHITSFRDPANRFFSCYNQMLRQWHQGYVNTTRVPEETKRFLHFYEGGNMSAHTEAFQAFVEAFDGTQIFDEHLKLQVPQVSDIKTGRSLKVDEAYDMSSLSSDLKRLSDRLQIHNGFNLSKQHNPTRPEYKLDAKAMKNSTLRKICQLSALDHCCLNYRLPSVCEGEVLCRWVSKPELSEQMLIEPISPFPTQI